jgi:Fur family ferric uptake transcriptional regulator
MDRSGSALEPATVRDHLRERGFRWTPQRRAILEILRSAAGHVTAAELVERCRAVDPEVTPSTVYRTLDVFEELSLVVHSHGPNGRQEFHAVPDDEHAHLACDTCGNTWEVAKDELTSLVDALRRAHGFVASVSHLTISGTCSDCSDRDRQRTALMAPAHTADG